MSTAASQSVPMAAGSGVPTNWLHPAGEAAPGAPKGLVDLFVSPTTTVTKAQDAGLASVSPIWFVLIAGVLLAALLAVLVWRYRRPLLLRWRLWRLGRLLGRRSADRPSIEFLAEALMWSLWRYFAPAESIAADGRPGLDRRTLPLHWRSVIGRLDVLRFAVDTGDEAARRSAFGDILQDIRRLPLRRVEALRSPELLREKPC